MSKSKAKTVYVCNECGGDTPKWQGQCPHCKAWNTLTERQDLSGASNRLGATSNARTSWTGQRTKPEPLRSVKSEQYPRIDMGMEELNRVFGGGIVKGSVSLIGGEPGAGKSTLLLQSLASMSQRVKCLYVTGEESKNQVALRAERLGLGDAEIELQAQTCLENIIEDAEELQPDVMVIDSIQTVYSALLESAPGSVTQVRECAAGLTRFAKQTGVAVLLVGHVTKEGSIAGPRVLEHIVDAVLSIEAEPGSSFRMLRALKNRFGSANEMGVFSMTEKGLEEVSNPSSMFLTQHDAPVPGCCIFAAMEGNRPFLVEVQALVEETPMSNPRRYTSGIALDKLNMLLAIINKHGGLQGFDQNVYLKVVGGVKLTEPASDLAALLAVHSSFVGRPLPQGLIVFGEVGLAGEVRPVSDAETRLKEAAKLGFKTAILPSANKQTKRIEGIDVMYVKRITDALDNLRELRDAA
jgi:DNA repair protein RadA/Sms